jgi:hypothetical protein
MQHDKEQTPTTITAPHTRPRCLSLMAKGNYRCVGTGSQRELIESFQYDLLIPLVSLYEKCVLNTIKCER